MHLLFLRIENDTYPQVIKRGLPLATERSVPLSVASSAMKSTLLILLWGGSAIKKLENSDFTDRKFRQLRLELWKIQLSGYSPVWNFTIVRGFYLVPVTTWFFFGCIIILMRIPIDQPVISRIEWDKVFSVAHLRLWHRKIIKLSLADLNTTIDWYKWLYLIGFKHHPGHGKSPFLIGGLQLGKSSISLQMF